MYLDVPTWGLFPLSKGIEGNLTGEGIERSVDIPGVATGNFKLLLDMDNQDLVFSYALNIKFAGDLKEPGFGILSLTECVISYFMYSFTA